MRTLKRLLIANRGEIALRIATTARRMGIQTVAVYSEADRQAAFVAACDQAVCIGPASARESYLDAQRLLAAAASTGADAIHPGYGFLSENEGFAQQVQDTGLIFVGPPPTAISAMGSKSAAKRLMQQAGVPLVPGYHGDDQSDAHLQQQADAVGYPLLLKASAGGGGKGMRIVRASDEFAAALQSCRREAINAFADDRMLIERYVERGRHVEVQVFADTQGNTVHLFERDCSVQRRHQKVIEEAPAPGLSAALRAAMGAAAVNAARAVGYVGAGTVEFILAPDGAFYFMEMNTRLQVEHPVTEMITGLDLVALQLRVAAGEPLPFRQADLSINGHAIELRIYAENADQGFLPSIGTLHRLRWPEALRFAVNTHIAGQSVHYSGHPVSLRLDAGVDEGDTISSHYDPMIGKLIAWAPDRAGAIARLLDALPQLQIAGVHTNTAFLTRLLADHAFAQADLDTGLIARRAEQLKPPAACPPPLLVLACCAFESKAVTNPATGVWNDPWSSLTDWRLSGAAQRTCLLTCRGQAHVIVRTVLSADLLSVTVDGGELCSVHVLANGSDGFIRAEIGGQVHEADVFWHAGSLHLFAGGELHVINRTDPRRAEEAGSGGSLTAPMPGKVLTVLVTPGQKVAAGQALLVMEAMKMEHTLHAPRDGTLLRCLYAAGDTVAEGAALLELEPENA